MRRCEGCFKDYEGEDYVVALPHPAFNTDEGFKTVCSACRKKLIDAWNGLSNGSRYVT